MFEAQYICEKIFKLSYTCKVIVNSNYLLVDRTQCPQVLQTVCAQFSRFESVIIRQPLVHQLVYQSVLASSLTPTSLSSPSLIHVTPPSWPTPIPALVGGTSTSTARPSSTTLLLRHMRVRSCAMLSAVSVMPTPLLIASIGTTSLR